MTGRPPYRGFAVLLTLALLAGCSGTGTPSAPSPSPSADATTPSPSVAASTTPAPGKVDPKVLYDATATTRSQLNATFVHMTVLVDKSKTLTRRFAGSLAKLDADHHDVSATWEQNDTIRKRVAVVAGTYYEAPRKGVPSGRSIRPRPHGRQTPSCWTCGPTRGSARA